MFSWLYNMFCSKQEVYELPSEVKDWLDDYDYGPHTTTTVTTTTCVVKPMLSKLRHAMRKG